MIGNYSLGVTFEGEDARFSLVARSFRQVKLMGLLNVADVSSKVPGEVRKQLATFLSKHRASRLETILAVPRGDVIVRHLTLPVEAEGNLAKVVEYQVASFLPSEEVSVCYDFHAARSSDPKLLHVSIFLIPAPVLDSRLKMCESFGIKLDRVVPVGAAWANYHATLSNKFKGAAALWVTSNGEGYEVVGVRNQSLVWWREVQGADASASGALRDQADAFRAEVQLPLETVVDVVAVGEVRGFPREGEWPSCRLHTLVRAADFGLQIASPDLAGKILPDYFLATATALVGSARRPPIPVNLIPPERRVKTSKWVKVPVGVLAATNVLLGLALLLQPPVQQRAYSSALDREVSRLEPEVKRIRTVEAQIADSQQRSNVLREIRKSNSLALEILRELSNVLPKTTFLTDLNLKNEIVEFSGVSESATALPQMLDNSPYFKDVEFVAPITRDVTGREFCRVRVKLEQKTLFHLPEPQVLNKKTK
ncbi:MAG: PilN domain-containing protein [Acidobacteria bacterium]|nr:PilN domain-containing protein [Acidobacteriota bacterium]